MKVNQIILKVIFNIHTQIEGTAIIEESLTVINERYASNKRTIYENLQVMLKVNKNTKITFNFQISIRATPMQQEALTVN